MPLQNRVTPFGELIADPARGLFMGNRGGRLHDEARRLGASRWISRRWICCLLAFRGRSRDVWGAGYSELFFLDEVTALAAGHRPCFECRRADALAFAAGRRAAELDARLHAERLDGRAKRLHRLAAAALPDGAMLARDGAAFAVRGDALLPWRPGGYGAAVPFTRRGIVMVLTPPAALDALRAGYRPRWHDSAS